jgi:hypothetical protein
MDAMRNMAPDATCMRLCGVLTMKTPKNMWSLAIPGTKPRMPPRRKRIPKSIPRGLTIGNLLAVETT